MAHSHHEGLSCSCCNKIWKAFLPHITPPPAPSNCEINEQSAPIIFKATHNVGDIITKGYIQTMANGQNDLVEAMGIHNGKIIAIGEFDDVKKAMPANSDIVYLTHGHTLLPGLIEPHLHILPTSLFNCGISVSPFNGQYLNPHYNRASVLAILKANIPSNPSDWLFGGDVDPSLFVNGEKEFNADVLNDVSKQNPIFLMNASMHLAYINKAAIDLVAKKGVICNDNGVLHEIDEIMPVLSLLPKPSNEAFTKQVNLLFANASKRGVTYIYDAGIDAPASNKDFDQVAFLKHLAHQPDCKIRIGGSLVAPHLKDFNSHIKGKYAPNQGDEKFNLAFIKVVADGSNQGLTGYQYTPYDCDENYTPYQAENADIEKQNNVGLFNYGYPVEFDALISTAHDNGWPVMIHANGDHAMERTLKAFDNAYGNGSSFTYRNRIEHASLLSDTNLSDMARLGVSPSFLIGHAGYWGWVFSQTILGQTRTQQLDRCHSALHQYNMRITLHSDYSVTPLGPLRMMEQAITRKMEGAPKELGPQILNSAECITRFEALKAVTYDAAWQCYAEQWVGSLEVGKCADFVILEQSPLTYVAPHSANSVAGMRDIPVIETWKAGKRVYLNEELYEEKTIVVKKPLSGVEICEKIINVGA
ncbi:amidohydrolase [Pseudoalteromonas tunicata]|uniref:amidohydrolase n=1 Tax=Pseudoalteromonas tunicata TaxID=314281 RepID=UPI00273FE030|nr:amidohydrolase [Pseudoalteromonas tunicata]MDP5213400.1 amidohydrolase [Pseudoalteromonas tunicata]